jgi:hypothetical protein
MNVEEKKALISDFLARCNRYAEGELQRYARELTGASAWEAMQIQDKIGHWTAYRAFNQFTIDELAGPELDEWFRQA